MFIYDYVLYNGEPIIEFRLKYLNDYVDYFIIVESIYTHSGKKKDNLKKMYNYQLETLWMRIILNTKLIILKNMNMKVIQIQNQNKKNKNKIIYSII